MTPEVMKRFSAPPSVYPDPSQPPDDDDSESSLSDGSKKVKTAQSFESLFNKESLSDIVFDINDGEFVFHAHKMIVGLKSERLAALINSVMSSSSTSSSALPPSDSNMSVGSGNNNSSNNGSNNSRKPVLCLQEEPECSAVFSRFLYFIYSGAVWLHRDYVLPLYQLSVKYGVGALATHCENYIIQLLGKSLAAAQGDTANGGPPPPTLPVTTVCDLCEEPGYREETRKLAFQVLCSRFNDLVRTERWVSCAWLTVRDLLRCDECGCDENLILVAATDWMKRNRLQDKGRIQEILSSIRYPRLPRRVLYHLHTTASFKNFPPVQDLIEAAIRFHCFKDVPEAQDEFTGLQYRARGRNRSNRHTVCGGETHGQNTNNNNNNHNTNNNNNTCQVQGHPPSAQHQSAATGRESPQRSRHQHHNHHHHTEDNNNNGHGRSRDLLAPRHHQNQQRSRSQDSESGGGRNNSGHRHDARLCPRHQRTTGPEALVSSFHPNTCSPVAAVQPRVQCQPSSNVERGSDHGGSSPDLTLHINIHSHS